MNAKKFLNNNSYKEISGLFKVMLMLIEDMKKDHDFHYQKLYEEIPEDYHGVINTADHFTPEKCGAVDITLFEFNHAQIHVIRHILWV